MNVNQNPKDRSKDLLDRKNKQLAHQGRYIDTKILWKQLNLFRQDPSIISLLLQNKKSYFNKDNLMFSPFHPYKSIKTSQGRQPVNLLLGEIHNDRNLLPITYNEQLSKAAQQMAEAFKYSHENNTNFQASALIKQITNKLKTNNIFKFVAPMACLVGVGFNDQFEPLISLLIGDGDPQKQNRKIILSNKFKFGGVGHTLVTGSLICAIYILTQDIIDVKQNQH